jgi:hypothetical protein
MHNTWSEYKDSNLGPPGPKPGALARLRHTPKLGGGWEDRTPTSCLQSTCAPIITNPPILAPEAGIEPTTN